MEQIDCVIIGAGVIGLAIARRLAQAGREVIVIEAAEGIRVSTKAEAGCIWTRVVRTSGGFVIHLINLTNQAETTWDAEKNDAETVEGLHLRLIPTGSAPTVLAADPESGTGMVDVPRILDEGADIRNPLSGAQTTMLFELPPLTTWLMLFVPATPRGAAK